MKRTRRNALGRLGMDALLSAGRPGETPVQELKHLSIATIHSNPYQPRTDISEADLATLADSIKKQGILQPLLVRATKGGDYELIAGERRLRAAKLAGQETVPVLVKEASDQDLAVLALVENIQRSNLNVLDEASSYRKLMSTFKCTQQVVADLTGRSRPAVANLVRLLELSAKPRELLRQGKLEMGQARVLLRLPPERQAEVAEVIVTEQLSVRQSEAMVEALLKPRPAKAADVAVADHETASLEKELSDRLGTPVSMSHHKSGRGKLSIRYANLDVLEGVLELLRRR